MFCKLFLVIGTRRRTSIQGLMAKDIAEHFRRSPMRISQAVIEVENKLLKDESFGKIVEKLEKDLIKQAKKKYFITIA